MLNTMEEINLNDELFSPKEQEIMDFVTPEGINIEELERFGTISIVEKTEDQVITQTIDFISFDGKVSFTKVKSYYKHNADYEKVQEYNSLIVQAVKKEKYEDAEKYKRLKEKLLLTTITGS